MTRLDDLQRNGYKLFQDPEKFCFGVDAVLLTGFAKLKKGDYALDLCTGSGVIPILLCAKSEQTRFCGLEIQPDFVELARRSVHINGLDDRIHIQECDIRNAAAYYPKASFDAVTVNPPYIQAKAGVHGSKAIAKHEILCSLEDVIRAAAVLLKPGGRFFIVHRPPRLVDLFCLSRQNGLEPKSLRFVQAYADREPMLVLVEAVKGGGVMLKTSAPLVIYDAKGIYTKEVSEIYGRDDNSQPMPELGAF